MAYHYFADIAVTQVYNFVYLIIGLIFLFGILLYLLGKLFENNKLIDLSKSFLIEAILTAVLVFLLSAMDYVLYVFSIELANRYLSATSSNPPPVGTVGDVADIAVEVIKQGPLNCIISIRKFMTFLYVSIGGAFKGKTAFIKLEGTGTGTGIYGFFMQNVIGTSINLEFYYLLTIKMILFFKYVLFGLFFPVGVAIRGLKGYQGVGGFLMSLGIGFVLIFPFVYLFSLLLFPVSSCTPPLQIAEQDPCSYLNPLSYAPDAFFVFSYLFSQGNVFSMLKNVLFHFNTTLTEISFSLCISPFIAFGATVSFIHIATAVFGGRITELGRGLFKLL